ncbi:Mu transposase domain-containing protein [Sorangium sp. So ce448]
MVPPLSFDGNRYSVPSEAADTTLRLVATDVEARLIDGNRVVGQHACS